MRLWTFFVVLLVFLGGSSASKREKLLSALGVPSDARSVVIIGQAAHLDWDWLNFFSTNVNNIPPDHSGINYWNPDPRETPQPTDTIFPQATKLMAATPGRYGYHVAETAFLQRLAGDREGVWRQMKGFNPKTFSIVGGGMVSPDNLLPESEAMLRNYLSGIAWLTAQNVTWSGTVWMPDDFGHDSQLPVVMEALGVKAVSFARLPGSCSQGQDNVPPGYKSVHHIILDPEVGGLNFLWEANDGSPVFVYYMPQHYCAGDSLNSRSCEANSPKDASFCKCSVTCSTPEQHLQAWVNVRQPLSVTPFMYVAAGCDFAMPVSDLTRALDTWNRQIYPKTGVYAISSQFDKYVDLVMDYLSHNTTTKLQRRSYHGPSPQTTFRPSPYWTGFYTSRPALKIRHYRASRTLQAAETLALVARTLRLPNAPSQRDIDAAWEALSPSTHHDFITGTANDWTYRGEQLPLLAALLVNATNLLGRGFSALTSPSPSSSPGALVFNQNGFSVGGLVELPPSLKPSFPNSQLSHSGRLLTYLTAPSLGYMFHTGGALPPFKPVVVQQEGPAITLTNQFLRATLAPDQGWVIKSLVDLTLGTEVLAGHSFQWRYDRGNIYRYGFEEGCGFDQYEVRVSPSPAHVLEAGPLRALVRASFQIVATRPVPLDPQNYTVEYSLSLNEPYLRINFTGAAAGVSSVITSLKLAAPIPQYEHGTTYHWDVKAPFAYGRQPDFLVTMEATHDYFLPLDAAARPLAAIYHASSPAWGVINDTIHGILLRNSPGGFPRCNGYGADGEDEDVHSIEFAVRAPSGLAPSASGQPQKEARAYHTPLRAVPLASRSLAAAAPEIFSLASMQEPSPVFLTAAKTGTFHPTPVLRLYNPTNQMAEPTLLVAQELQGSRAVYSTALEAPDPSTPPLPLVDGGTKLALKRALATLQLQE